MSLAAHYSRFRVAERVLLTGHSHQAWPDVGFAAQQQAWLDAAEYVDDKWPLAEAKAAAVASGFARLIGDDAANIALGVNTHELVTRWLSALPLRARPRLVTTDGEFHTIRRQLDRLGEEGIEVVRIAAHPVDDLCARMATAIDDRTAGVLLSSVLFETAEIVPGGADVAAAARRHGSLLLVDAYHHLNVVPFDVAALDLADAFVTGGGYKYCQLGEGNGFLRVPSSATLRPVLTGWFAEFAELEAGGAHGVRYGRGAAAFAGATYDPTSHYRGAAVFAFHADQQLTPQRLRDINARQTALLQEAIEALDLDAAKAAIYRVPAQRRGGFLSLRTPYGKELVQALRDRGVFADARGGTLRLGPAPYVTEQQLRDAALALGESVAALRR
jgi:kynureninase